MDLLLWQNICMLGERDTPDLIKRTCSLRQLNLVIDGYSMFHFYADSDEAMEHIHDKFMLLKQNQLISERDRSLPLQIINPDNNGNTALFLALAN